MIRVDVERLANSRILLTASRDSAELWHLVLEPGSALELAAMLRNGVDKVDPVRSWTLFRDAYCAGCGHVHEPELAGICVGCPCPGPNLTRT
jgi:hypothetical protein